MKKLTNKQGFTLIEVVLVLAIGGLIFLLAFVAFQQVSANRRDTQRRADAGRIVAEMQNYLADNSNGSIPLVVTDHLETGVNQGVCAPGTVAGGVFPDFNTFSTKYLCKDGQFQSPDKTNYAITTGTPAKNQIKYTTGNVFQPTVNYTLCDGSNMNYQQNPKAFKLEIGLEKGVACRDSK